jgi:multiple sugar transport system ATP-binding protein
MADKIVVLRDGNIEQAGEPIELYARPRNLFVAGFLGAPQMNFVKARAGNRDGGFGVQIEGGPWVPLSGRGDGLGEGAPVTVGIRPEHATLDGPLAATVETTEVLGSETIIHARQPNGTPFTLARRGISSAKAGDTLSLSLPPAFVHLFDETGTAVSAGPDWRRDYLTA